MKDEIRFQNCYDIDLKVMKQYAKYVFCRSTRILGIILMIVSAGALAVSLGIGSSWSESVLFILCFLGGLLIYSYYIVILKVMKRQMKESEGRDLPECVIDFTEDGIQWKQGSAEAAYEYRNLKKIYSLPEIYALVMMPNQAVLVKKGCFSKGKEEEFEQFLQKKMM